MVQQGGNVAAGRGNEHGIALANVLTRDDALHLVLSAAGPVRLGRYLTHTDVVVYVFPRPWGGFIGEVAQVLNLFGCHVSSFPVSQFLTARAYSSVRSAPLSVARRMTSASWLVSMESNTAWARSNGASGNSCPNTASSKPSAARSIGVVIGSPGRGFAFDTRGL